MADGRQANGGARSGAGRKPKAVSDELRGLLDKCAPIKKLEGIIAKLVEDACHPSIKIRSEARKLLLAYKYGTPIARQEISGELDVNMPSPDELKAKFAQRRKAIEVLDD